MLRAIDIRPRGFPTLFAALLFTCTSSAEAQNLVPNPGFEGNSGLALPIGTGVVNAPGGVPDSWRAFAVNGEIDLEIVPLAADELFPGSPAVNAVLLRVNAYGADQGFDDDNGRFPIIPGVEYHAEFWVRSANADGSDQTFNFGFPIFNADGVYLGREPGAAGGLTATSEWQKIVGPTFSDAEARQAHISWRTVQDGGEDAILIALPFVLEPELPAVSQIAGDCDQDGMRSLADIICEVRLLFPGFVLTDRTPPSGPCDGGASDPGNVAVLDVTGDGAFNGADVAALARFIFAGGPPPAQGEGCFEVSTVGCAASAACP